MDKIDTLFQKAQKYLRSAAVLLELEDYDSCASRSYFAMFYAAQGALLQETQSFSAKRGIRSTFTERFVDTGRLPERAAEALNRGQELQEMGDYGYDFSVSLQDAEHLLQEAEAFVNSIIRMIERARESSEKPN